MAALLIEGGKPLEGKINIHGAKNSVLPILAATLLNSGRNVIHNCPKLKDVNASLEILKYIGCSVERVNDTVIVDSAEVDCHHIPEALMREMRSSIVFLGAILARCSEALLSTPGGCELGPRPIDLHLKAFKELGIEVDEQHGFISCDAKNMHNGDIHLSLPSVGATENIMLAASVSEGITTISNPAKEPEIIDLQDYINAMGGNISGAGTDLIKIEGVKTFKDVEYRIIPDRIVAASYMAAVAAVGGEIELINVIPEHMQSVIAVLKEANCEINSMDNSISIAVSTLIKGIDYIRTAPHPGFPTDAQAPIMAALTVADGTSIIAENIFENRFKHVVELNRMGADIKVDGRLAVVRGVPQLTSAKVVATDLRGAAGLVIAGLVAKGVTEVHGLEHLDRGYVAFEEGLALLGANIKRME